MKTTKPSKQFKLEKFHTEILISYKTRAGSADYELSMENTVERPTEQDEQNLQGKQSWFAFHTPDNFTANSPTAPHDLLHSTTNTKCWTITVCHSQ